MQCIINDSIFGLHVLNMGYNFLFVVSKPAPSFNGTAVIDGAFKQIKLADFKGI